MEEDKIEETNLKTSSFPIVDFIETIAVDCFVLGNKITYIQY